MSVSTPVPATNRLLAALPARAHDRLMACAEDTNLAFTEILAEPGQPLRHVYFPTDSFISLVTALPGQPSLEVGLIGDEGMLGASLVLGTGTSPTRALVQGAGPAWRMDADDFLGVVKHSASLQQLVKRYLRATLEQLLQTTACIRFHRVEARLARWLLMTHDRAHSDTFNLTHDFIAYMLGVRRAGISGAAAALQRRKLIRYRRGKVTVLDRGGLEEAACGCYAADKATYARILEAH